MTTSEIISAGSLIVSAGALMWTAKGVNASRRATQLQIFDDIFRDIKRLDAEYEKQFKANGNHPTQGWCFEFFNTLEYLSFLLNRKMILRDELQGFYAGAMSHFHETFTATATPSDLDDPDFFPEFRKLHRRLAKTHVRQ